MFVTISVLAISNIENTTQHTNKINHNHMAMNDTYRYQSSLGASQTMG